MAKEPPAAAINQLVNGRSGMLCGRLGGWRAPRPPRGNGRDCADKFYFCRRRPDCVRRSLESNRVRRVGTPPCAPVRSMHAHVRSLAAAAGGQPTPRALAAAGLALDPSPSPAPRNDASEGRALATLFKPISLDFYSRPGTVGRLASLAKASARTTARPAAPDVQRRHQRRHGAAVRQHGSTAGTASALGKAGTGVGSLILKIWNPSGPTRRKGSGALPPAAGPAPRVPRPKTPAGHVPKGTGRPWPKVYTFWWAGPPVERSSWRTRGPGPPSETGRSRPIRFSFAFSPIMFFPHPKHLGRPNRDPCGPGLRCAASTLCLTLPRDRTFRVAIRLPARAARVRVTGHCGQAPPSRSDQPVPSRRSWLILVRGPVSRRHTHAHRRHRRSLLSSCGVVPVGALCSCGAAAEWRARAQTVTGDMGQGWEPASCRPTPSQADPGAEIGGEGLLRPDSSQAPLARPQWISLAWRHAAGAAPVQAPPLTVPHADLNPRKLVPARLLQRINSDSVFNSESALRTHFGTEP